MAANRSKWQPFIIAQVIAYLMGMLTYYQVISQQRRMRMVDVPDAQYFLDANAPVHDYPYEKTFEQARSEPCLVLHTSGSTGMPKPIIIKNGWFTPTDAFHNLPQLAGGEMAFTPLENLR